MNKNRKVWYRRLFKYYSQRFLPSWYILAFDSLSVFVAYFIAYAIRQNFDVFSIELPLLAVQSTVVTAFYFLSFILFKSYSGIIRHTSIIDAFRVLQACGVALILIVTLNAFSSAWGIQYFNSLSLGVLFIHSLLSLFTIIGARFIIKSIFYRLTGFGKKESKRVIIYGAGAAGMLTRNALLQDKHISYTIVGYIDENNTKIGKSLDGIHIYSPEAVFRQDFMDRTFAEQIIIAIQCLDSDKQRAIVEKALDFNLEAKVVPAIDSWINGQLSSEQIRRVRIEELLHRDPIRIDSRQVSSSLKGKVVMITGAAGSIGSGIVKQALAYGPSKLILLDQAESALYDLQTEINGMPALQPYLHLAEYVIASIKDRFRMQQIFETYRPEIIFHAAAYKHVPLMESNPYEALLVNVFGTKTLVDLSVRYMVKKFVMISTDKAVNPTNVMGASKRIAEIYTQGLSNGKTQFITTRFGNVLDSNGSVVPLFRKQIERGGPVTITHREITRYFMTIPEACSLVLEAGAMGNGGEIFVFDMGKPVKIYDLACKMIKLSGFEVGRDIQIMEIGLRPGEKLYEELLNHQENTLPTYHPKILRARVRVYDKEFVDKRLNELSGLILEGDTFQLVAKMKEMVPEFISNNSVYKVLDNQVVANR